MAAGIALFDMDDTLVGANTAALYFRQQRQADTLSRRQAARIALAFVGYRLNIVDMGRLIVQGAASAKGASAQAMADACDQLYHGHVKQLILPKAIACLRDHQAKGRAVAIVTASTPYIARLLAQDLAVPALLCTELAVDANGLFSGDLVGPPRFGEEKVQRSETFAKQNGCTLQQAWFYTDSHSDLPLLRAVGHPHVVRPDLRLRMASHMRPG